MLCPLTTRGITRCVHRVTQAFLGFFDVVVTDWCWTHVSMRDRHGLFSQYTKPLDRIIMQILGLQRITILHL